jgi:uroporphyrinogen-III synthase
MGTADRSARHVPHHGTVTDALDGTPPAELPLAGYTVAVTAARRREELGALLERRGARVVHAPAIRIVPLADDTELVAATREVLARPIDLVVATTGVGFRGWLEAADAWDLPLVEHLRSARVLARGPKARGAIRGGGLVDAWSPESESSAEVLTHLMSGAEGPLQGRRIAVQLHGDPLLDLVTGLRQTGAEVLTVPVYRWVLPEDVAPVHRLVADVIAGAVDAVTFTSAPAAAALLTVAEKDGRREELVSALRGRVMVVAVGPVTAGPLDAEGIPSFQPERARLGALAREVVARLPERDPVLTVGDHTLQVRGFAAVLDERVVELAPGPMAVLRELARDPGRVVPRPELIGCLPGGGDGHAVEMAVTRLRAALGAPVVETVVKRGYRLKV